MLQLVKSEKRAAVRKQWMLRARNLEPEICRLFGHIDADGSSAIDLPEFLKAAADAGLHDTKALEALFQCKDADGNGVLDVAEFIECVYLGIRLLPQLASVCTHCGLALAVPVCALSHACPILCKPLAVSSATALGSWSASMTLSKLLQRRATRRRSARSASIASTRSLHAQSKLATATAATGAPRSRMSSAPRRSKRGCWQRGARALHARASRAAAPRT